MRGHKRGKSSRHRGSMLVEGALAILPLWAVLFGVVDLSVAIFVQNTVQFAVCQGVRYAVTSQTLTGLGQDASIKSVVQGYTLGFLDYLSSDHIGANRISITYYDPLTLLPVTGVGSNIGGNIVVVSATGLSWAWMMPLLRSAAPLTFSVSSADMMEATPLAGAPARQRGSAMIELALSLTVAFPLLLGVGAIGLRLGRTLQATQLTRYVAHMYALGADFSLTGTQAIASTLSRDFNLTGTGRAVLLFSTIFRVQQTDCTAAGLQTCPNLNLPVFTQRIAIGNTALRTSAFGTPAATYIGRGGTEDRRSTRL